jgi:hypothetical protein
MIMTMVGQCRRCETSIERAGGSHLTQALLAGGPGAAGADKICSHIGGHNW